MGLDGRTDERWVRSQIRERNDGELPPNRSPAIEIRQRLL
jgi:hypothetical protein